MEHKHNENKNIVQDNCCSTNETMNTAKAPVHSDDDGHNHDAEDKDDFMTVAVIRKKLKSILDDLKPEEPKDMNDVNYSDDIDSLMKELEEKDNFEISFEDEDDLLSNVNDLL